MFQGLHLLLSLTIISSIYLVSINFHLPSLATMNFTCQSLLLQDLLDCLEFTFLGLLCLPRVHPFRTSSLVQSSLLQVFLTYLEFTSQDFHNFHTYLEFTPLGLSHLSRVHSFRTFITFTPGQSLLLQYFFTCLEFTLLRLPQLPIQSSLAYLDFNTNIGWTFNQCQVSSLFNPLGLPQPLTYSTILLKYQNLRLGMIASTILINDFNYQVKIHKRNLPQRKKKSDHVTERYK